MYNVIAILYTDINFKKHKFVKMKKKTNPSHPLMNAPVQAYTGMSNISLPLCQHHGKTTGGFTRA